MFLHGGGSEAVDRLCVVADARDAGPVGPERRDDLGLKCVGVLVLVDEHVVETLADAISGGRVGEQAVPEQQEVVVVEDRLGLLRVRVRLEELAQTDFGVLAPREATS